MSGTAARSTWADRMVAETGTRRSTTSRVIAMAKTASLKNSTRSNSRFPASLISPLPPHTSDAAQPVGLRTGRLRTGGPGTGGPGTGNPPPGRSGPGVAPGVMSSLDMGRLLAVLTRRCAAGRGSERTVLRASSTRAGPARKLGARFRDEFGARLGGKLGGGQRPRGLLDQAGRLQFAVDHAELAQPPRTDQDPAFQRANGLVIGGHGIGQCPAQPVDVLAQAG